MNHIDIEVYYYIKLIIMNKDCITLNIIYIIII